MKSLRGTQTEREDPKRFLVPSALGLAAKKEVRPDPLQGGSPAALGAASASMQADRAPFLWSETWMPRV